MTAVIRERQVTEAQQEQLELEELAPDKFDPEIEFKVNKQASNNRKEIRYGTYTREQVAALIAASKASYEPETPHRSASSNYPTLSREECERLVREHFEYKEREKKKRQELEQWDSLKTTESVKKIANTKKRSTSTKG